MSKSRRIELQKFRDSPESAGCPISYFAYSDLNSKWICGDPNGNIQMIGASDGTISKFSVSESDPITSVVLHHSKAALFFAAGNEVSSYDLDAEGNASVIIRSELAINDMSLCKKQPFCFVASGSPDIKIYNPEAKDPGTVVEKLDTYGNGSRSISLSQDEKFLGIVDFEGNVLIYRLDFVESLALQRISIDKTLEYRRREIVETKLARDVSKAGLRVSWFPHDTIKAFVVPSSGGSICVYNQKETERWDEVMFSAISDISGFFHAEIDLNIAVFSPNGRYLASADVNGCVIIWVVELQGKQEPKKITSDSFSSIAKIECGCTLYDVCWGPNDGDNYLMIASVDKYSRVDDVIDTASGASLPTGTITITTTTITPAATEIRARIDVSGGDVSASLSSLLSSGVTPSVSRVLLSDKPIPTPAPTATAMEVTVVDEPSSAATTSTVIVPTSAASKPDTDTNQQQQQQQSNFRRLQKKSGTDAEKTVADDNDDDALLEKEDNSPWALTSSSSVAEESVEAIKRQLMNKHSVLDEPTVDDDDFIADDHAADADGFSALDQDALVKAMQLAARGDSTGSSNGSNLAAALASVLHGQSVKLQPPFQPSSTKFDEKLRRYLVWNHVGNIFLRDETTSNRIEVRFANTSGRNKNDAFTDNYGFVMASLAYEGAIYATEAETSQTAPNNDPDFVDTAKGSTIMYRAFPGQVQLNGANETFVYTLDNKEAAQAVAVGMGWCAVATSKGFLRVFSSTGVQLQIFWLKGPVVTLVGAGSQLAVFYHSSAPVNDSQQIAVEVFEISRKSNTRRSVVQLSVPMAAKSSLEWAGFDMDSGNLVVMDSDGVLSMLLCSMGWQWMPVLDIKVIRKSTEHKYWPIAVKTNKLASILLNGESRPAVYPQPTPTLKTFQLPIVALTEGKDREMSNNRAQQLVWDDANAAHYDAMKDSYSATGTLPEGITAVSLYEALAQKQNEADKAVLTLLQDACKFNRIASCLDLAHSLRTDKGLQAAITICNHFGRSPVAAKIEELAQHRMELNAAVQAEAATSVDRNDNYQHQYQQQEQYEDDDNDNYQQERSATAVAPGALSRRVSVSASNQEFSSGSIKNKYASSSVAEEEDTEDIPAAPKKVALTNPFAKQSPIASPGKRKNAFESFKELKGSPSPKKPMLSRQSSFAQAARSKMTTKMNLL